MIARHDQTGSSEAVDELPRLAELMLLGALRQIPRQHDDVGWLAFDQLQDPRRESVQMGRPEVDVGDVADLAHVSDSDPRAVSAFARRPDDDRRTLEDVLPQHDVDLFGDRIGSEQ